MIIPDWPSPDSQSAVIGKHEWSVARLIFLVRDLEVLDISLNHLNIYTSYKNLTLREMVMHFKAVKNADLDRPIILDEDGEILDGRHRIMKALLNGKDTIKAVRFDVNPSPDRVIDNPD